MFRVTALHVKPLTPRRGAEASKKLFSAKQGQYLAFIFYYTKIHGRAPAESDMLNYFKVSPPSVHQMVLTLEANGFGSIMLEFALGSGVRLAAFTGTFQFGLYLSSIQQSRQCGGARGSLCFISSLRFANHHPFQRISDGGQEHGFVWELGHLCLPGSVGADDRQNHSYHNIRQWCTERNDGEHQRLHHQFGLWDDDAHQ